MRVVEGIILTCGLLGIGCQLTPPTDRMNNPHDGGLEVGSSQLPEAQVALGVDHLLRSPEHRAFLAGKRVGLITNQTGLTADGVSTIDALFNHPEIKRVLLFSPEHGIRGTDPAGNPVGDSVDEKTGLVIKSLYGNTKKPTPEMLSGVDVLVFDIQDIGVRYYTYVWTMVLAMEAAAENQKRFMVLDRPNPIGGEKLEGNVLDPAFKTFVGLHPVPNRHGLTAGELALLVKSELELNVDLRVVPLLGWKRSMLFESTGLTWKAPSPAIQTVEHAKHYPGTCLFEATPLSVGRGTAAAFMQVGAPWLSSGCLVEKLAGLKLPGVRFEAVRFTPVKPGDKKFDGVEVKGVRLHITDEASYQPVRTSVVMLHAIREMHGDLLTPTTYLDSLAGTDLLRRGILAGESVEQLMAGWADQLEAFQARRAPFLLYP